jgi:hypothetical protein
MIASCWLFLYDLYYDARNHENQVIPRIRNVLFVPILLRFLVIRSGMASETISVSTV